MRQRRGDKGAVLVEFVLVVPIFALLLMGVVDLGMAYRESLNLSGAVRSAARQATSAGTTRNADFLALQAFEATMGQAHNVTIEKVVIYNTTDTGGDPLDPSCFTSSNPPASAKCNVYTGTQISQIGTDYLTHFGSANACDPGAWDASWCPLVRHDLQGDPPDYVGVYAVVSYRSWTSLFPATRTLTDRAVLRIEPRVT